MYSWPALVEIDPVLNKFFQCRDQNTWNLVVSKNAVLNLQSGHVTVDDSFNVPAGITQLRCAVLFIVIVVDQLSRCIFRQESD